MNGTTNKPAKNKTILTTNMPAHSMAKPGTLQNGKSIIFYSPGFVTFLTDVNSPADSISEIEYQQGNENYLEMKHDYLFNHMIEALANLPLR